MSSIGRRQRGFTLVELLVSIALVGIVMASVYSSYYSQQKAYVTQEQVAAMQQNLRAALYHLERDIRMAGYNPTGATGAGILTAGENSIQITKDDNGTPDGLFNGANENITYLLSGGILRRDPGSMQVAENIDALQFEYLDENGAVTANIAAMRSVQICIVARTSRVDSGYTDTRMYRNLQNEIIYPPGGVYPSGDAARFRRNMLRVEVRCRNIGM